MRSRKKLLIQLYKIFPFSLKGDAIIETRDVTCDVSCVINFFGRIGLLEGILFSLVEQDLPKERFEVILVEDRGGTPEGREIAQRFASLVTLRYFALPDNYGLMGYSRNYGLSRTRGRYILFLDDDTVVLQKNFLSRLIDVFRDTSMDGVIPRGNASFCLRKGNYFHHDAFFPTSRCTAYRREVLQTLGGFVSDMVGQEDVEFVMRFLTAGRTFLRASELEYCHPPLLVTNYRKPMAVGHSFYRLKDRYPFVVWLLLILNCGRHMPLFLLPGRKFREMGRFGFGFLLGVIASPFKRKGFRYG